MRGREGRKNDREWERKNDRERGTEVREGEGNERMGEERDGTMTGMDK